MQVTIIELSHIHAQLPYTVCPPYMVTCIIDQCHCMVLVKHWHGLTVHVMAVASVNCGEEHRKKNHIVSLCKYV